MHIIFDLLLIAIIGLCVFRYCKNGLVAGICAVAAIAVAISVASTVANTYRSEFTSMLNPFVGGVVDNMMTSTLSTEEEQNDEKKKQQQEETTGGLWGSPKIILTDREKQDSFRVSYAVLRWVGLTDNTAVSMAEELSAEYPDVGRELTAALSLKLCDNVGFLLVFVVIFILVMIIFEVLGNLLDIKVKMPGYETVNKITGAIFGAVQGVALVLVIAIIFRYVGFVIKPEIMDKTILFKYVINHNFIAAKLGL